MLWRWLAGESKVNRVGWLEWDGAEDLRSRSRWWLALLSSAGEERGAWFMEAMLLRVSVQGKNTPVSVRWSHPHAMFPGLSLRKCSGIYGAQCGLLMAPSDSLGFSTQSTCNYRYHVWRCIFIIFYNKSYLIVL